METFQKILIACGGEAAMRIARTCRRVGLVAVGMDLREIDPDADETQPLPEGRVPPEETVIAAARAASCDAIHPGGALPIEQARLARAVVDAGLRFVGAPADSLSIFADKTAQRARAEAESIRTVPGSEGPVADLATAHAIAKELGFPIFVKPVAGAGGVGIARADDSADLEDAMRSAATHARARFGDPRFYLEKWIEMPRQIEVTVVADAHGELVAVGERECSLQIGKNVLICESPSPLLVNSPNGEAMREAICESAITLAEAFGLVGVGNFEFLVDPSGCFYFLEANAGLRGGHAVTEMVTGLDLGECQLQLCAGEKMAESLLTVQPTGFALSAKILADDVDGDEAQIVEAIRVPPAPHGKVRFESEVRVGSSIPTTGHTLLALIATFAPIRHQAFLALDRVLAETHFVPVPTNRELLRKILNDESFRAGQYDATFIDRMLGQR